MDNLSVMDDICDRAAARLKLGTDRHWHVTMTYRHGAFQLCAKWRNKRIVAPMRNTSILSDVDVQNWAITDLFHVVMAGLRNDDE